MIFLNNSANVLLMLNNLSLQWRALGGNESCNKDINGSGDEDRKMGNKESWLWGFGKH